MKKLLALLLFALAGNFALAQSSTDLFLNVTIPEEDTTYVTYSSYRVSAGTHPDAKAFINGEEMKVYSNGAFATLLKVSPEDTSYVNFKVSLNGESIEREMVFIRPKTVFDEALPPKTITNAMMQPASDEWLRTGEVLEVKFYGSPGEEAVFNIDGFKRNIPMKELPTDLTGGRKGVYIGHYEVKPGDYVSDKNITFKIKKGLFGYVKKKSRAKVSFNGLPRVGEVKTSRPFLFVGLGTDRLGGTRYDYQEQGVRLHITGKKLNNYRVKLSSGLSAWIPSYQVELLQENTPIPKSLTGNISITGNDEEDLILVSLSEKLPYTSTQELDSNQIIVNVYGATSNTNWKTKHLSSEGIEEVEWRQVEDDWFQLRIKLNHKQNWGYSIGYGNSNSLKIKVRRAPKVISSENPLKSLLIAVDAGHGGEANGSLGSTGLMEKTVTLDISKKLEKVLQERGAYTVMTREDDSDVLMATRADIVLDSKAVMLVSIHANSIGYPSDPFATKGTATFYKHIAHKPLAELLYHKMLELGLDQYGLTGSFNFSLNAPTEFPNVLVETAFMSNPEDEVLLGDEEFQMKIAHKIADGLEEYFLKYADTDEMEVATDAEAEKED